MPDVHIEIITKEQVSFSEIGLWHPSQENFYHLGQVHSIALSPDDEKLFVCHMSDFAVEWDIETKEISRYLSNIYVNSLTFNKDGSRLLANFIPNTIAELDPGDFHTIQCFGSENDLRRPLIYSPSPVHEKSALGLYWNDTAREWALDSSKALAYSCPSDRIKAVSYTPDGSGILFATQNGYLHRWDREAGQLTGSVQFNLPIEALVCRPDGQRLLLSFGCMGLKEVDMNTFEVLAEIDGAAISNALVLHMDYSPDGQRVVFPCDMDAAEWDLANGRLNRLYKKHEDYVQMVLYRKSGDRFISCACDGMVYEWHTDGRLLSAFNPSVPIEQREFMTLEVNDENHRE